MFNIFVLTLREGIDALRTTRESGEIFQVTAFFLLLISVQWVIYAIHDLGWFALHDRANGRA